MKMTDFCGVVLFSLIEVDQHFRGMYCLHHQGDVGRYDVCCKEYFVKVRGLCLG
jgi:hypothetical protein